MGGFNHGCLNSGLWRWTPRSGLHISQRCAHMWSQGHRSYGCLILSNYFTLDVVFTFEFILEKATSKLEKTNNKTNPKSLNPPQLAIEPIFICIFASDLEDLARP